MITLDGANRAGNVAGEFKSWLHTFTINNTYERKTRKNGMELRWAVGSGDLQPCAVGLFTLTKGENSNDVTGEEYYYFTPLQMAREINYSVKHSTYS